MKKHIHLLFFISLILLGSSSCENLGGEGSSGGTIAEGQVVDIATGLPVADAWVQLYKPGKGSSSGYSKEGEPYRTDSNGRFYFHYEAASESAYLLMAHSDKGHYTDWQDAPELKSGRSNKEVKVKVRAPAWVKVKLTDELPKSKVWIDIGGYTEGGEHFALPSDTVFYRFTRSNFSRRFSWQIINEMGIATRYFQDYYVSSMDTVIVEIKF